MKKTKIDISGIDKGIDPEAAQDYVQHRINKGKPLTQRAFNQAMKKTLQAHEVGMTPTELIDWTIEKGWDGININFTKSALMREQQAIIECHNGVPTTKQLRLHEELMDTSWGEQ
jgi:hypothetical protein